VAAPAVRLRARRGRATAEPAAARAGQRRGGGVQRPRLGGASGRERPELSRRVVITGHTGFAGAHLAAACGEVTGLSRGTGCDLLDAAATRAAIAAARPDVVYHLAARAHVGESWRDPAGTLHDNVAMTLHVLEAVRAEAPGAVVVVASSGEVYGPPAALPVDEAAPLAPRNPYAVSKAACDLLAGMYADLHVIRARAFNHAGPGQDPSYAIASFARQAARGASRIVTGNPDTRRDYTDVRDVVRAYRLLAERGEPGVYNVCSGRSASTRELVGMLGAEVEVDPALLRPNEVMDLYGSYERLRAATGWEPEIPLERTLTDARESWRRQAGPGPARTAAPRPARGRSPRS
jgi:GDP-4-dehydro-6-deoxy-D-mannose reductase